MISVKKPCIDRVAISFNGFNLRRKVHKLMTMWWYSLKYYNITIFSYPRLKSTVITVDMYVKVKAGKGVISEIIHKL